MARRALHECNEPGCHNLCSTPYCEEHTRPREKPQDRRPSARERGYDRLWEKRRGVFLGRPENQLCKRCAAAGRRGVPATVVHHRNGNPEDNRDENLEGLCRDCHERLHGRKRRRWDENLDMD